MSKLFLSIVNMSFSACWLVLTLLLVRLFLKKAPKWIMILLWAIVAVRLILPISIESEMSLIPSAKIIDPIATMESTPKIHTGFPMVNNVINPVIEDYHYSASKESSSPLQNGICVASIVWIVGVLALIAYAVVSYLRVKKMTRTAILFRERIFQSENVVSPFVLGWMKPKIYLPFCMDENDMALAIAHEQAHIRRKDYWWKPLGFTILAVHWFNPLVWLAYVLLCRDIELACDEKVAKTLSLEERADYSQALLNFSVNRRTIAFCPLAFGEVGVKVRVKSVLSYKRPAFWLILVSLIVSILIAACFLTDPVADKLENIESLTLTSRIEDTVRVWVSDGENYHSVGIVERELIAELLNMEISEKEISMERSENRDRTHTLVLQTAKEAEPSYLFFLSGLYIHFDSDFATVWVKDGTKTTLSYQVMAPQKAKELYERIDEVSFDVVDHAIFSPIDEATFDIDGDGKEEYCALYYGPTSGLFTFAFSVFEDSEIEYFNIFNAPHMNLRFVSDADGQIMLYGKQMDKDRYLNIDVEDGNIVIYSDGLDISYWGEQGIHSPFAPQVIWEQSEPVETIEGNLKTYSQMSDGTWQTGGYRYKYRLEITGRMPMAVADTTYVYLSNLESISFERAMWASGLSSNTEDYFLLTEAVLVEIKTE